MTRSWHRTGQRPNENESKIGGHFYPGETEGSSVILPILGDERIRDKSRRSLDENSHLHSGTEKLQFRKKNEVEVDLIETAAQLWMVSISKLDEENSRRLMSPVRGKNNCKSYLEEDTSS